jgi:hypothetical protein
MAHTPPPPSVESIFDADDYQRENGIFSEDMAPSDDGASWTSVTTTSSMAEAHPRYMPPHKRHAHVEMGEFVTMQSRDTNKPDDQGVSNRHFEKLLFFVHFTLTKVNISALIKRFPSLHFVTDDHRNHDHPVAHVVTQVGTRMLQRMITAGSRVLDVFGNPKSAAAFNRSQSRAKNPKTMETLVNIFCGADFIREINKWGPQVIDGVGQWLRGSLEDLTSVELKEFSVFQMIHTLYYLKPQQISRILHLSPGSKVLALIHRHDKSHGWINEGEQEYWVRGGIVKQRNVLTNTTYFHPNITPFWFREDKTYYPPCENLGFSWECHFVCEDTWIVEIVAADKSRQVDGTVEEWKRMFELDEEIELEHLKTRSGKAEPVVILPSDDGKFVELDVQSIPLFNVLRRQAAGKSRVGADGRRLYDSLLATSKHLVAPGALFPGLEPIICPDHLLVDHVISAFVTDVARERDIMAAVGLLSPVLVSHASSIRGGPRLSRFTVSSVVEIVRAGVKSGLVLNRVVRATDVVGSALTHLDDALSE